MGMMILLLSAVAGVILAAAVALKVMFAITEALRAASPLGQLENDILYRRRAIEDAEKDLALSDEDSPHRHRLEAVIDLHGRLIKEDIARMQEVVSAQHEMKVLKR